LEKIEKLSRRGSREGPKSENRILFPSLDTVRESPPLTFHPESFHVEDKLFSTLDTATRVKISHPESGDYGYRWVDQRFAERPDGGLSTDFDELKESIY
jgi:hypothetical protein